LPIGGTVQIFKVMRQMVLESAGKNFLLTKVDWWFAYTQMTVDLVAQSGYPVNQITCLNNTIDTDNFKQQLASISEADLIAAREALRIGLGEPVGIFCGSLYPEKRLDFLIAALDKIYDKSPDFHCIVLGDGPSMPFMREAGSSRTWLHLVGVTKGEQKAMYFRLADFMVNPGLVGLHIVDAFCAGLVLVTTLGARHSPEVAYLRNGVNGLITTDSVEEYTHSVLALIHDSKKLDKIKVAALADAEIYTLNNMVTQFVDGIKKCLAH
jgi:L-malate glycosyltransferase